VECGKEKRNVNGKTDEWTAIKKKVALMIISMIILMIILMIHIITFRTSKLPGEEEMSVQ
jgi:uncharacterized membrane protein YvbJ